MSSNMRLAAVMVCSMVAVRKQISRDDNMHIYSPSYGYRDGLRLAMKLRFMMRNFYTGLPYQAGKTLVAKKCL